MSTLIKRAQLGADELQQLRWLLGGMLILLSVWTVLYMEVDAWTLMVLTTVATCASMAWPTLPARVPRVAHTLAFPVIVAFFAADLWLKTEVLPAMVRLDILLLLYRSISYRQRRDDLQIIVLGLFLIVVAGVLTVSLTFAAQILAYTACALLFLLIITLSEASTGKPAPKKMEIPAAPPAWALHTHWPTLFRRLRDAADWRVIGLGVALFIGVVVVSALLFLAIPRFQFQNSLFVDRFITKKAKSGFSETVRFGDVTQIVEDDTIALNVDPSDHTLITATPYWRMLVLDSYQDGTFKVSPWLKQHFGRERTNYTFLGRTMQRRGREAAAHWTFYFESGISRYLPLLGQFEMLQLQEIKNLHHAVNLVVVALREEPVSMTAYRVQGIDLSPALVDTAFAEDLRRPDTARRHATMRRVLPNSHSSNQTILEGIVGEITGGATMPAAEFSRRAIEWLQRRHSYTLEPRIPNGPADPLVRWLASEEPGHCELFAGSYVLLARTAGFYARMVTGFKGGRWNAFSNNFTIRNSDAHAWAEIFDQSSSSWLRADPLGVSAGSQAEQEAKGEQAIAAREDRSWSARVDSLRVFWYRRIVNFGQQSQIETLKAMKEATEKSGKRIRMAVLEAIEAIKTWLTSPWDGRRLLTVAGALAGITGMVWAWLAFGRGWWRAVTLRRGPRHEDPVRREAAQWLARIGGYEQALAVTEVVPQLQRLRFGAVRTWPKPEQVFRRARGALRDARHGVARASRP